MTTKMAVEVTTADEVERNLDLMHGFVQSMLVDPENMESVPDGVRIVLLPQDDPQWFEINLEMAVNLARRGKSVYLRQVDRHGRPIDLD